MRILINVNEQISALAMEKHFQASSLQATVTATPKDMMLEILKACKIDLVAYYAEEVDAAELTVLFEEVGSVNADILRILFIKKENLCMISEGLESSIDECFTIPLDSSDLMMRLRRLVRSSEPKKTATETPLQSEDVREIPEPVRSTEQTARQAGPVPESTWQVQPQQTVPQPVIEYEQPAPRTVPLPDVPLQPVQNQPQPVQPVPQPAQIVEPPVIPVPQPAQIIEPPVIPVPQPAQIIEQPVQPVPQPAQIIEPPVIPVPQPAQIIEPPVQPVPQPAQIIEQPVIPVPQPAQIIEQPVIPVPQPAQIIEQPLIPVPQPAQIIEPPVQPVPQPVQIAPQPEPPEYRPEILQKPQIDPDLPQQEYVPAHRDVFSEPLNINFTYEPEGFPQAPASEIIPEKAEPQTENVDYIKGKKSKAKSPLRHLNKTELLEIIYDQEKKFDDVNKKVAELTRQIEDREMLISESRSIAEAAMKLGGIVEAAQKSTELS